MTARRWIARSIIAGASGSVVHFLFMYFKSATGLLPQFQPYHTFQLALSNWLGTNVPHTVPWVLSFLNGMTILSLLFGRIHRLLPGRNGLTKGTTFGLIGWVFMGLVFFPLIGLGPFATNVGLGAAPAFLPLGMLLTYSVVMATVYVALQDANPDH
jgi:uncharacterized protein DUF6789